MKKKVIALLVWFLIIAVTIEVSPYLLYAVLGYGSFDQAQIRTELFSDGYLGLNLQLPEHEKTADEEIVSNEDWFKNQALHPYFGFVTPLPGKGNEFGFPGKSPMVHHEDTLVNVCLAGGSVAIQIYFFGREKLIEALEKYPEFEGKRIKVVLLAQPGFKQPQQLMAFNYFLALGAEYDLVINLDGFNEVALPLGDNLPIGVWPAYPRYWNLYSRQKVSEKLVRASAIQAQIQSKRAETKNRFRGRFLHRSRFALLVWKTLDNRYANEHYLLEQEIRAEATKGEHDHQSFGPVYTFTDTTSFLEEQADLWMRSSIQMAAIAQRSDIPYIHFIQPNQYVPNGKTFTEEELSRAFVQGPFPYKRAVQLAYPMLSDRVQDMKAVGVNIVDLTWFFKEEKRSVYLDNCCHFNELGCEQIGEYIGTEAVRMLANEP